MAENSRRSDGWVNEGFGFGTARDHSSSGYFYSDFLSEGQLRALWRSEDLAARIVEEPTETMLRGGFFVNLKEEVDNEEKTANKGEEKVGAQNKKEKEDLRADFFDVPTPAPKTPPKPIKGENERIKEQEKALTKQIKELCILPSVEKALNYARAFGGGALLVGADDGQDISKPLNEEKIRRVLYVNALDAFELFPHRWYGDPLAPKYGSVELYQLSPQGTPGLQSVRSGTLIHESRIIRFEGIVTGARSLAEGIAPGWGDSVLLRVNQNLQDLSVSFRAVCVLLRSYGMAFVKFGGLGGLVGSDDFAKTLKERVQQVAEQGSSLNALVLTEHDEFGRVSISLAGISDLLDRLMSRVSAASGIPVNILFGQGAKGLNASNDGDIRNFYDRVANKRQSVLQPALDRLVRLLLLAKEGPTKGADVPFSVEFEPLWQPSETERATARKTQADTDVAYINAGVVTPEEIAESRFGGAGYSYETRVNHEAREALVRDYEEAQKEHVETLEKQAQNATEEAPESTQPNEPNANSFGAAKKSS